MTVAFHALWMLCALGVIVCAAVAARRVVDLCGLLLGFVAAAALTTPQRLPDPGWVGAVSACAAALVLFRPRFALVSAVWGGVLGGILTALFEVQGLPAPLALGIVALCSGIAIWLSRARETFAPEVLQDEALLALCLLGIAVSVIPGVLDGWQAAANLTVVQGESGDATPVPAWTLGVVGTSVILGALYSVWSRR